MFYWKISLWKESSQKVIKERRLLGFSHTTHWLLAQVLKCSILLNIGWYYCRSEPQCKKIPYYTVTICIFRDVHADAWNSLNHYEPVYNRYIRWHAKSFLVAPPSSSKCVSMPFGPATEQMRRVFRKELHLFTSILCPPWSFLETKADTGCECCCTLALDEGKASF